MTTQRELAVRFTELHVPGSPLALANAWDVVSARLVEASGAPAVATTSAGVAWSLGAADGNEIPRDLVVYLVARIASGARVPVTADIEGGFGKTAADVGETISQILEAGAVGVNIEDAHPTTDSPLRPIAEQAERLTAAREAAEQSKIPLFINARVDVYLRGAGEESGRLNETLRRARAYLDAGASGIFVPGVAEAETIAQLTQAIDAPVNVLVAPGALSVPELAKLGVARVSLGPAVAEAAYAVVSRATKELIASGTYESVRDGLSYPELNSLMRP